MSSEAEPKTTASSEAQNVVSDPAPEETGEATNGDAAPIESTSDANEAAVALDAPALPPASPSDEAKTAGKESDLDMKATGTVEGAVSGEAVVAPEGEEAAGSAKRGGNNKRRSSAGVPEHKGKKLNKKKSMVTLHLDAKPGDYYWARMKGYPPWPAIICDEEMLPESLLQNRPVTAMRPDGSYRADFLEGGKNAKDRTYPVMYLATNEFSWTPNVDLKPLDFDEVEGAEQGKKTKQLWAAYQLCAERHELQHFKDLLAEHEEAMREEAAEIERMEAESAAKAEKAEKKAKRKSKAADEVVDEDVTMEDGDVEEEEDAPAKKAKATKKRKKDAESDGEAAKPAKTPKTSTKLKVNLPKNAEGESATKPKAKAKASKAAKESPKPPQMSEADKRQKREKEVLYFRHKLQKGFLSTEAAPKESEMQVMAEYFNSLEGYEDLEHSIIRNTKIHKVLKAIVKLSAIPRDEEYQFKQRSIDLLQKWQKILSENAEAGDNTEVGESAKTNGEDEGPKDAEMKDEAAEAGEEEDKKEEVENGAAEEEDADVNMDEAEAEAKEDAPVENGVEKTEEEAIEDAVAEGEAAA